MCWYEVLQVHADTYFQKWSLLLLFTFYFHSVGMKWNHQRDSRSICHRFIKDIHVQVIPSGIFNNETYFLSTMLHDQCIILCILIKTTIDNRFILRNCCEMPWSQTCSGGVCRQRTGPYTYQANDRNQWCHSQTTSQGMYSISQWIAVWVTSYQHAEFTG